MKAFSQIYKRKQTMKLLLLQEFETKKEVINFGLQLGVWRSPVAYLHGVQGVVGSNPATPTVLIQ